MLGGLQVQVQQKNMMFVKHLQENTGLRFLGRVKNERQSQGFAFLDSPQKT